MPSNKQNTKAWAITKTQEKPFQTKKKETLIATCPPHPLCYHPTQRWMNNGYVLIYSDINVWWQIYSMTCDVDETGWKTGMSTRTLLKSCGLVLLNYSRTTFHFLLFSSQQINKLNKMMVTFSLSPAMYNICPPGGKKNMIMSKFTYEWEMISTILFSLEYIDNK